MTRNDCQTCLEVDCRCDPDGWREELESSDRAREYWEVPRAAWFGEGSAGPERTGPQPTVRSENGPPNGRPLTEPWTDRRTG